MATAAPPVPEIAQAEVASSPTPEPYPTGPVGQVVAWLDGLPGYGLWLLGGLIVVQVAWAHAVLWASGRLPFGAFDPPALALSVYGPYTLAGIGFGIRIGRSALRSFWPATGWPDSERPWWQHQMAYLPARLEWVALGIGVVSGLVALAAASDAVLGPSEGRLPVYLAYVPTFVLGYGLLAPAFIMTLRWLQLVARIHREANAIDPFDRVPVYAFSRLTVVVGLAYVGAAYYSFTVNAAFQAGNLLALSFLSTTTLFGMVTFIAPLWGIHGRLVREKERLLLDVERRVGRVATELYARIDAGNLSESGSVDDALSALNSLRERVVHLPTWPWPPQLLRGFVSALLLPIVIFIASRLVSTLLP